MEVLQGEKLSLISEYVLVVLSVTATLLGTVFVGTWIQNYPDNPSSFLLWYGSMLLAAGVVLGIILFAESSE